MMETPPAAWYEDGRTDAEKQAEKERLFIEEIDRLPKEIMNQLDDLAGWLAEYGLAVDLIPHLEAAYALVATVQDALAEPDLD